MKLEVRTEKGRVLFWTEHPECLPGREELASLRRAGLMIVKDGKVLK